MRIITAFLIASAVFIWAFGWYGVAALLPEEEGNSDSPTIPMFYDLRRVKK